MAFNWLSPLFFVFFSGLAFSYEPRNHEGTCTVHPQRVHHIKMTSFMFNVLLVLLGIHVVVEALMSIREALNDPHGVLSNWDEYSVDPCSWAMITCSSDYLVVGLSVLLLLLHSFFVCMFAAFAFSKLAVLLYLVLQGSSKPISLWNFICSN